MTDDPLAGMVELAFKEARNSGLTVHDAATLVAETIRGQLAKEADSDTAPADRVNVQSIVSARNGTPLVQCRAGYEQWQWDIPEAHAMTRRQSRPAKAPTGRELVALAGGPLDRRWYWADDWANEQRIAQWAIDHDQALNPAHAAGDPQPSTTAPPTPRSTTPTATAPGRSGPGSAGQPMSDHPAAWLGGLDPPPEPRTVAT
jgi:hypothetical protein